MLPASVPTPSLFVLAFAARTVVSTQPAYLQFARLYLVAL